MLMKFHSYTGTQAFGWILLVLFILLQTKFALSHIFFVKQVFLAIMTKFLSIDRFHFYPRRCGPIPKIKDMVDNKEKEDVVCSFILMSNYLGQLQFVNIFLSNDT